MSWLLPKCCAFIILSFHRWPAPLAWMPPNLSWGDCRLYAFLQRTLDEDCRQAEEPKQLVDEASRFHLGRQRQHSAVICSGACYSAAEYCAPVWSRSAHTSQVDVQLNSTIHLISLVPSVLHLCRVFQCSPTLNCQPYEGRLPLTSWWRKSSNMTVGQSSLMYLAHHCYDWHPGSRCG